MNGGGQARPAFSADSFNTATPGMQQQTMQPMPRPAAVPPGMEAAAATGAWSPAQMGVGTNTPWQYNAQGQPMGRGVIQDASGQWVPKASVYGSPVHDPNNPRGMGPGGMAGAFAPGGMAGVGGMPGNPRQGPGMPGAGAQANLQRLNAYADVNRLSPQQTLQMQLGNMQTARDSFGNPAFAGSQALYDQQLAQLQQQLAAMGGPTKMPPQTGY